jgi:hypothetical protein
MRLKICLFGTFDPWEPARELLSILPPAFEKTSNLKWLRQQLGRRKPFRQPLLFLLLIEGQDQGLVFGEVAITVDPMRIGIVVGVNEDAADRGELK